MAGDALKEALLTIKTTAPKYLKGAEDHTIRKRLLLKILQVSGNIIYNVRTPQMIWDVEVREPKVRVMNGGQRHQFIQTDAYEQLCIDHAELESTDQLPRRQQMINSNSPQQIVDLAGTKMEKLVRRMSRMVNSQFYADNSTGVNTGMMTGIKSFLKPDLVGSAAADQVLLPTAGTTYGGKSIELGAFGGQWSANLGTSPSSVSANDWPWGQGSTEYDWNTPKMLNTNATFNGQTGWTQNCLHVMRRMSGVLASTGGEGDAPTVHLLGLDLLQEAKDKLEERERLYGYSDYAKQLGFPDTLQYEGAVVSHDYDCPSQEGYAINPNEIALYSVHDQLFFTNASWETLEQASVMLCGFLGNWRWVPKCVGGYFAR